jgi:hypothetical protein
MSLLVMQNNMNNLGLGIKHYAGREAKHVKIAKYAEPKCFQV